MNKINIKLIIALGILTFILGLFPTIVSADSFYARSGVEFISDNSTNNQDYYNNNRNNPIPFINSVNQNNTEQNSQLINISVTGYNFTQNSIIKLNGFNRATTFIDSTRLIMNINKSEISNNKENYLVTVFNPTPGGGHSNVFSLTVIKNNNTNNTNTIPVSNTVKNSTKTIEKTNTENIVNEKENENVYSDLAASAIFGENSFMPSGIIQWLFLAIFILLVIKLWRKVYVSEQEKSVPLKHA